MKPFSHHPAERAGADMPGLGARSVREEVLDGILPLPDGVEIEERLAQPAAQEAGAHGGLGGVEDGHETVPLFAAGALGQLEVAASLGVELHVAIDAVGAQRLDVGQCRALGVGEVGQEPTGRLHGDALVRQAEAVERFDSEMVDQRVVRAVGLPQPGVGAADGDLAADPFRTSVPGVERSVSGENELDDAQAQQLTALAANSPVERSA